jgi:hypothetical protein
MTGVQSVQDSAPLTGGPAVPRIPVPGAAPPSPSGEATPEHYTLPDRAMAGRLAEKESLFEAARKTGQAARATKAQKLSLDQAKARLEQIKLYSPYPADESPRAALIRRLIRLQEPPGDPATLDFGVAKITPGATDQELSHAIDTVQTAQAQLGADSVAPAPAGEDPQPAIALSVSVGHTWPQGTSISSANDVHYLRTL